MSRIRIESVSGPLAAQPEVARRAATLLARGEVMGFVAPFSGPLTVEVVRDSLSGLAAHGVATRAAVGVDEDQLGEAIELALEGTEHSPMPDGEWASMLETLGDDLLARLVCVSPSSLRRYAAGARRAPDSVVGRLHTLALVVADLAGAYNDYGIRRWFARPRTVLEGRSPEAVLAGEWDPDGLEAARVRRLATGVVGASAS